MKTSYSYIYKFYKYIIYNESTYLTFFKPVGQKEVLVLGYTHRHLLKHLPFAL